MRRRRRPARRRRSAPRGGASRCREGHRLAAGVADVELGHLGLAVAIDKAEADPAATHVARPLPALLGYNSALFRGRSHNRRTSRGQSCAGGFVAAAGRQGTNEFHAVSFHRSGELARLAAGPSGTSIDDTFSAEGANRKNGGRMERETALDLAGCGWFAATRAAQGPIGRGDGLEPLGGVLRAVHVGMDTDAPRSDRPGGPPRATPTAKRPRSGRPRPGAAGGPRPAHPLWAGLGPGPAAPGAG